MESRITVYFRYVENNHIVNDGPWLLRTVPRIGETMVMREKQYVVKNVIHELKENRIILTIS